MLIALWVAVIKPNRNSIEEAVEELDPCALLVRMQNGAVTEASRR